MADSKKRKTSDEEPVARRETVRRHPPDYDLSGFKHTFYRELYNQEVDFRSLARQDADFAAMYVNLHPPAILFHVQGN
jgi:hypothetical protein